LKVSDNGSIDQNLLVAVVEHINKYVRSYLCKDIPFFLTLDRHASRKGQEWISVCRQHNIVAVVNASYTTQITQPCDQDVNKVINSSGKYLRDLFLSSGFFDTRQVAFNLMCGVYGIQAVKPHDITTSFEKTGVFPLDPTVAEKFRSVHNDVDVEVVQSAENGNNSTRITDTQTVEELQTILNRAGGASMKLSDICKLFHDRETVQLIASSHRTRSTATQNSSSNTRKGLESAVSSVHLNCGTPAECVTVDEMFNRRSEMVAAEAKRRN